MAPSALHKVAISAVKSTTSALTRRNPARRKKPAALPLRPMEPDRFRPPRGEKQVFLPNFTLTFIRGNRHQPPNHASFIVPLWMNKLDLKDYLYNLYSVRTISIRSYIIHGKMRRDPRTNQKSRIAQKKKMTIEMAQGDSFVWPEEPKDMEPWDKTMQDRIAEVRKERMKGIDKSGRDLKQKGEDEKSRLRERAKALLSGKVRWKPGWEEGGSASGMMPAPVVGELRPSASA